MENEISKAIQQSNGKVISTVSTPTTHKPTRLTLLSIQMPQCKW
jgi:hypothetical protein